MKKTILFLIFLSSIIYSEAQITLEKSYNHSGTFVEIEPGIFKFFVMDVPLKQIRLYNDDHSLFKTIQLSVPSGYFLYDVKYISRYTFNDDSNIELLYIYQKTEIINSLNVNSYGMKVINDNGSILLNLQDGAYAEIIATSNGNRLLAYQYIWNTSYYLINTNIYTLSGNPSATNYTPLNPTIVAFPNPVSANSSLNLSLPGDLNISSYKIIDLNGKIISEKHLSQYGTQAELVVPNANKGMYLLQLQDKDKIQQTIKIEIQ